MLPTRSPFRMASEKMKKPAKSWKWGHPKTQKVTGISFISLLKSSYNIFSTKYRDYNSKLQLVKRMVVTTILECFLNNMFNFKYFFSEP